MSRFARICISKLILVYCIVRSISAYFCFTNKFLVINIKYFKNFIIMIKFKVYDKEGFNERKSNFINIDIIYISCRMFI